MLDKSKFLPPVCRCAPPESTDSTLSDGPEPVGAAARLKSVPLTKSYINDLILASEHAVFQPISLLPQIIVCHSGLSGALQSLYKKYISSEVPLLKGY